MMGEARSMRGVLSTAIKMGELSLSQVAIYAFPLIFAVVCARTLGPANYGVVAFYTALTSFLCMFVEFGFDSIGVREVHASNGKEPEQVMWNVTLAKLIVSLLTCIVAVPVLLVTRPAEASLSYALLGYLIAFAFDSSWYLRSLELMRSVLYVAVISRFAGIALLVIVVTGHDDLARAMWTYTFVAWAHALVSWVLMHRMHVLGKPRLDVPHLRSLFRSGASIVVGNLSGASLTSGGIAALGVLADPVLTGAANIALRIRTAGLAILMPLSLLGFVRLSSLVGSGRASAVYLGRRLFYALIAVSTAVALLIIANADLLAALAYGHSKAPEAASVLVRLLAIGIPVSVAGNLFGLQCLTLFEQEHAYVFVLIVAAVIFFGLLFFTNASKSPSYGWALLAADSWVVLAAGWHLRRTVKV
jgi:O-antigen/teichoic acid export membrane protein